MLIIATLDMMMAKRKIFLNKLSERIDLALSNLYILKTRINLKTVSYLRKPLLIEINFSISTTSSYREI